MHYVVKCYIMLYANLALHHALRARRDGGRAHAQANVKINDLLYASCALAAAAENGNRGQLCSNAYHVFQCCPLLLKRQSRAHMPCASHPQ